MSTKTQAARDAARPQETEAARPRPQAGPQAGARSEAAGQEGSAMELVVSRILQGGVLASAVTIALGLALWALTGQNGYGPGRPPAGWGAILQDAVRLRPMAVVQAGLGLLVLTPIFRVAASVVWFVQQRDWVYVAITAAVLLLLLGSLLAGSLGFASAAASPLY
ncbi:MAG TPA: DUF1634 domain-containing protein [Limnochordales bacterium]